ncbi:S8 family serine peptidase [Streptomyces sp. NPDC002889]|uniref:S8 family serine peptidase n=1 Tax=Streptomyces sp. NPDC002889 TaxID=3364669 RepID=UPI00367BE101
MTAGMSQIRKRSKPYVFRRGLLSTVAVIGTIAANVAGTAPAALAADVQSKQWYLDAMGAEEIWKTSTGKGIKVAVIDTGVNSSTPALTGQVQKGLDLTNVAGEATDDYDGHGTTMAELIAGTGRGGGLRGLAPDVKIIPYRIADENFEAKRKVNDWDVKEAIRAAADSDAQIISMSFGSKYWIAEEEEAVKYAQSKGKLFFAPVGNSAKKGNKPEYPANYAEVVGVAATGSDGEVADYSQHGDFVDIAAPGNDIPYWCDETFKRYCDGDGGTSAATAITSAAAALIWSAHPDWTGNQVLRVMFESAGRGDGWKKGTVSNYLGYGVVRPGAHINRGVGKPGDPNVNPLTNERVGGSSGSSASPNPSAPASSQAPKPKPGSNTTVAGSSSESSDGSGQLGWVLGAVAAVVVIGGGAVAILRKRRSA